MSSALDAAIAATPVRHRARIADAFRDSEIPLLRSFAYALIAANAAEAAQLAEMEVGLALQRAAENDAIAASLPPIPGPTEKRNK